MDIHDPKSHPSASIPKDIANLIRTLYDCLDDPSRIDEFAEIFTQDGSLKVKGQVYQGTKDIIEGQKLATKGGKWQHTIDSVYTFGTGEDVEWLMLDLRVEVTSCGGSPRRFETAARIQVVREEKQAKVKYLQVYVYEKKARLA